MTDGLEAHNFNCNISTKTTTPGKKGKGNDEETTSGKALVGNSFMTTGGMTTTVTNKHHAAHNLEEEEDDNTFASSINSTQSHLVENMSEDNFHNAQDVLPKTEEQPGQEEQAVTPILPPLHQVGLG